MNGTAQHIVVIGGGHAGCEAALAAARMGARVTLFALSLDSIAQMPCNPCIGGSAKGHLVREIDALGGEMGRAIDATFLQSRMLNASKGPAVHSLRAQADKKRYTTYMKRTLERELNLFLREGEIIEILTTQTRAEAETAQAGGGAEPGEWVSASSGFGGLAAHERDSATVGLACETDTGTSRSKPIIPQIRVSASHSPGSAPPPACAVSASARVAACASSASGRVVAVRTDSGEIIPCEAAIICSGTYLNARCLTGNTVTHTGPGGARNARHLTENLKTLGFTIQRFKTGTPARVHRRSLDFSKMAEQPGDTRLVPFSFETDPADIARVQLPCYLTYTTPETHAIIRENIHRSAMYSGLIDATGTRYCPSIEDKIMRFADKDRHPVFIEPEGEDTEEMYVQGMSSALAAEVQERVYRSVLGLENVEIMRHAYAIEYDCIDSTALTLGLEAKHVKGLFFAGQICGSSGYEEAASQGLVAGINAAGYPLRITREQGYIGVLIDDLVTKGTPEPYRMMTSRAEYRLLLRQDNADLRLTPAGRAAGLISDGRYAQFIKKREAIEAEITRLKNTTIPPEAANPLLLAKNATPLTSGAKLADLIKRPELTYDDIISLTPLSSMASHLNINLAPFYNTAPCVNITPDVEKDSGAPFLTNITPSTPPHPADITPCVPPLPTFILAAIREQINISIKYEGYIAMQREQAAQFVKAEKQVLPADLDYETIRGLRLEARQKLARLRPVNFGQASRITGVSPADLSVLMIYLKGRGT